MLSVWQPVQKFCKRDFVGRGYGKKYPIREINDNFPLYLIYRLKSVSFIGLFQKKITFLVRKFQKFCVWFLTLYAFIICQVIIRPQYYINASLISAPVLILYQNVRGT